MKKAVAVLKNDLQGFFLTAGKMDQIITIARIAPLTGRPPNIFNVVVAHNDVFILLNHQRQYVNFLIF